MEPFDWRTAPSSTMSGRWIRGGFGPMYGFGEESARADRAAADSVSLATCALIFAGNTRLPMVAGWDRLVPGLVLAPPSAISNTSPTRSCSSAPSRWQ